MLFVRTIVLVTPARELHLRKLDLYELEGNRPAGAGSTLTSKREGKEMFAFKTKCLLFRSSGNLAMTLFAYLPQKSR